MGRNELTYAIINGLYPALLCIHINRTCTGNSNRNRYEKRCNCCYRLRTICSDSCSSCKKVRLATWSHVLYAWLLLNGSNNAIPLLLLSAAPHSNPTSKNKSRTVLYKSAFTFYGFPRIYKLSRHSSLAK